MRILVVDDRVPDPHFGAGFPRAYMMLMSLIKLGHRILFFPIIKDTIKELDLGLLKSYGIDVCENLVAAAGEHVDAVIISRPHNVHYHMPTIRKQWPSAKVIYDTEALWYRRYDLQMSITGRLPSWNYRYDEIGLARAADLCFVVSDEEGNILRNNGVKQVVKLGHAMELNTKGLPFGQRSGLLFVGGNMEEESSNEDAIWWYLDNCWADLPGYCLDVTGSVTSRRLKAHSFAGVNLVGHVPDLVPLYQSRRVFVAATRFATGIPWKVHEAMSHGIPCLISKLLGHQLGVTDGVEAMVAETPADFVIKTRMLYEDRSLWEGVRARGFDLVRRDCCSKKFICTLRDNLCEP